MDIMKKSIILSLVSVVLLSITGCGKDRVPPDSFFEYMNNPMDKEPAKHVRDDGQRENRSDFSVDEDVEYETTDFDISDSSEKFTVKVTSKYVYFVFKHKSTAPNMQFIIDADNSFSTGYKSEGGAEYIVENNKLYRSLDANVWNWREMSGENAKVSAITRLGEEDIVRLNKELFKKNGEFQPFSVSAQALDKRWIPVVVSPQNYTKLVVDNTKYSINDAPILASQEYKEQTIAVRQSDTAIELYVWAVAYDPYMQIYLDTDSNATTGYKNPDIPGFGADYMIEDGILYRSNKQNIWGWVYVQPLYVRSWREEGKVAMRISVDRAGINLPEGNGFNLYMESNNEDWSQTHFLPQGGSFASVK